MLVFKCGQSRRAAVAALLSLSMLGPAGAAGHDDLELGVLPTLSTRVVFEVYQPLREYLEERLRKPVTLVTASNYRTYIERTQRGDYRFLVTAPHFARLAQTDAGYVPMVRVQRELRGIIVVRDNAAIRQLGDLRGKVVTTPEPLAIVTMLGAQFLRQNGLTAGANIELRPMTSFNSAVLALQKGEADAAITAPTALAQMSEVARRGLSTLAATPAVPPVVYLANGRVPAAEVEEMTRALLEFAGDPKRSAAFFGRTRFGGIVRLAPDELRVLDPYVAELRLLLKER